MSIRLENVNYIYREGSGQEKWALKNINLTIHDREFIGIVGHTGSGKSTLTQLLNGLEKPSSGTIYYNDEDIQADGYERRKLRQKVGLVFQYPEHQLFEVSVIKDVEFGPRNLGLSNLDVEKRSFDALKQVGLSDDLLDVAPFALSGGQKRRVAIAGVLAMQPEVLILDEPTAGLDPNERISLRNLIAREAMDKIVILATHIISDIDCVADHIILMKKGTNRGCKRPEEWMDSVKDKVWEITCDAGQAEEFQSLYNVTAMRQCREGINMRVLSEEDMEAKGWRHCEPTLDEVYLYYSSVQED